VQGGLSHKQNVRPSVKHVNKCDKTKETYANILIGPLPQERSTQLVLRLEEWLVGDDPST